MSRRITLLAIGLTVFVAPGTAGAAVFSNTNSILVDGPTGSVSPYPSAISVSGMDGVVTGVRATLSGINASSPEDLEIVLSAPDGRNTLLMLRTCVPPPALTGVAFTFDDAAGSTLAAMNCANTSGTFKPTSYGAQSPLFAPAPQPPYPVSLSTFSGGLANGSWQLWVFERAFQPLDSSIAGGWSLDLTTSGGPMPTPAPAATKKKCKKKKHRRGASAAKKKCKKKRRAA
jgi:hypothetical protein